MVFSYGYGRQQNRRLRKIQGNRWPFWWPCRCGGTMWGALLDGAHPVLHLKPLDATIGQVPASYCPGGHHGWWFRMKQNNTNKTQLSYFFTQKPSTFWDPKWTLYSAHQSDKLHKKCEIPQLELKSLWTFLAIKRYQRTKFQKDIKLAWRLSKKLAHICATSG